MPIHLPINTLIFDWGDTIMQDFELPGPMFLWDTVAWVPGAEESLKQFAKIYTCVIATSANRSGVKEMKAALIRLNAHEYFDHFFSSVDLGFRKPDPRYFKAITQKLGLIPKKCVMIGNSYSKDIVGAKAAGFQTVFFNADNSLGAFPAADDIIDNMENLSRVIPF